MLSEYKRDLQHHFPTKVYINIFVNLIPGKKLEVIPFIHIPIGPIERALNLLYIEEHYTCVLVENSHLLLLFPVSAMLGWVCLNERPWELILRL